VQFALEMCLAAQNRKKIQTDGRTDRIAMVKTRCVNIQLAENFGRIFQDKQ